MKLGRIIVAAIGLAALAAAYVTGSLYLLVVAVVAFVGGLYLMGANKKPVDKDKKNSSKR